MDQAFIDGVPVNPLGRDWVDLGLGGFLQHLSEDSSWRTLTYVAASVRDLSREQLTALAAENRGKFRAPTLRNVDKRPTLDYVKAYGHNGYFKSLKALVHFYNTRDVLPRCADAVTEANALAMNCWPAPEVRETVNVEDVGRLGLSESEEDDVVAFLRTLSDGFEPTR